MSAVSCALDCSRCTYSVGCLSGMGPGARSTADTHISSADRYPVRVVDGGSSAHIHRVGGGEKMDDACVASGTNYASTVSCAFQPSIAR